MRTSHAGAVTRRVALPALLVGLACLGLLVTACGDDGANAGDGSLEVVAGATFLADIAQNVAGDRFTVAALIPRDTDLHAFEPTPRDLAEVADADLIILNGGGLEEKLEEAVRSAGGDATIVEASAGLTPRTPQTGEPLHDSGGDADPHFWLDPTRVITYVENIRDAFAAADPDGAAEYEANAAAYIDELKALDAWIGNEVARIPEADRRLVMNHVSHGYFADRYGFRIVGAVIPSVATGASPTAQQLAELTAAIRAAGVKAIFVETDENPQLAQQIADETGVTVVDDLRDHSLSEPEGEAPTYIEMMKFDTRRIVEALAP